MIIERCRERVTSCRLPRRRLRLARRTGDPCYNLTAI